MYSKKRSELKACICIGLILCTIAWGGQSSETKPPPLRMLVMDPLSLRLACACVAGHAQRRYDQLATTLQTQLQRDVQVQFAEALPANQASNYDLIFGKYSLVQHDAQRVKLSLRPLALLTDKKGVLTVQGLFVVRSGDPARSIADLQDRKLIFGPPEEDEKHSAALTALEAFDIPRPQTLETRAGCNVAALAVLEKEADATVISDYALPLLSGCGTVESNELRVIGSTDPVPFITAFVTSRVHAKTEVKILKALESVASQPDLLKALESKNGFLRFPPLNPEQRWTDWRGPRRQAVIDSLPEKLPSHPQLLWSHTLTGPGMAGIAVAQNRVIVADKSLEDTHDIWRCLDADTGREHWTLKYPAAGDMDFTNSPRAFPVIKDGLVYLLGALGDLHCVQLETGKVQWHRHFHKDFQGELPTWGWCSTPLLVDDLLIINPGAAQASLVALDRHSGKIRWQSPGDPPGYASFILATFGGQRQIIGYDTLSLGGWDPQTGKRLWKLIPERDGDFNVATPIVLGDKLLVGTENNGTRLYAFDQPGRIRPEPLAYNEDLIPDTSTPVAFAGLIYGSCGRFYCLDSEQGLKTCWETDEDPFTDYCCFIAGKERLLVTSQSGHLHLLQASKTGLKIISHLNLFADVPDTERDVWSHPALVGNRFYIRNLLGVYCFLLN